MRNGRRLRKVVLWGMLLFVSILAGGLCRAYWYLTDGEMAARLIKQQAVRFLPGSILEPGQVKIGLLKGSISLRDVLLRQPIDGVMIPAVMIPRLNIQINSRKLAHGELEAREIHVSQPTLRLQQRRDGTWNLQGLLANPWPVPLVEHPPPIVIQNGTVELVTGEEEPSSTAEPASESPPAVGAGTAARVPAILRDVSLRIEGNGAAGRFKFEGLARGDLLFDRLLLRGTIDVNTGRITLSGDLTGLTLSETLRRRIPAEARPTLQAMALNGGVVDLEVSRFCFDPSAEPDSRFCYQAHARLRDGVWKCPKLPFPLNDLSALVHLEDGVMTIKHAQGSNGKTTLRAEEGTLDLNDLQRGLMDLRVKLTDLELDPQLREHTPPEYDELWDVFKPRGRIDAELRAVRRQVGEPIDLSATVDCRDIAGEYLYFRYPLDHLTGQLKWEKRLLTVDLQTLSVGGRPLRLQGKIQNPGLDAVVHLDIQADSIPIDDVLKKAMPADVRKVVEQFHPRGLVKAHATVVRQPEVGPKARPEGLITVVAQIDLSERCEMTWDGLPYPVRDLKGRLEIEPDNWVFKNMRGSNGQTTITANGRVKKLPRSKLRNGDDPLQVDVHLQADNLPFIRELRNALPPAWRERTWTTINPSGSCDVDAAVHVAPGVEDPGIAVENTHIVIMPRKESNVRLEIHRPAQGTDPGGTIDLPLENVLGRFVFDNGLVTMNDVNFQFRGAPVRFDRGTVRVEDTGQFELAVTDLWVEAIRFDQELRKKMPPLMQQFALRLDDGRTFRARGDLMIGWSGKQGEPAWCSWKNALAVFDNNTLMTGIRLEHIHGQIDNVRGWSNGIVLKVEGILNLGNVSVLGQQITNVESPFQVQNGVARVESLRGRFLGGEVLGEGQISLDATPRYSLKLLLRGAQLEEYARTLYGRQKYRGQIDAKFECRGLGGDIHSLNGSGEAHITEGDLGELPFVLRFATFLNKKLTLADTPRNPGKKTAFDSADVAFTITQGVSIIDPIKFTGNAFSLQGRGTLDPQGNIDLRLNVLLGRDRFHIKGVSDLLREASGPFLMAHVWGTPALPQYQVEMFPQVLELFKAIGQGRADRQP
jgi:AsmA-like C-terminal region